MTTIPREKMKELIAALPQDIAEIYESNETAETMLAIGRKYGLTIDKLGKLTSETGYVIVGASPARKFVETIGKVLGIPQEKAVQVAREINAKIFAPIRQSLKRLHGVSTNAPFLAEDVENLPTADKDWNAEVVSDRAYWEAVSKATHDAGAEEATTIPVHKEAATAPSAAVKPTPAPASDEPALAKEVARIMEGAAPPTPQTAKTPPRASAPNAIPDATTAVNETPPRVPSSPLDTVSEKLNELASAALTRETVKEQNPEAKPATASQAPPARSPAAPPSTDRTHDPYREPLDDT
ncbi:MAG: hypothetical protein HY471_00825 [Candidatus Sungbacteria bacterium]|nr:hypothetical protein [Candidatus Sungbacteria bacterium]